MNAWAGAGAIALAVASLAGCSGSDGQVLSLSEGQCFNYSGLGTSVADVPVVPCAGEHEAEVYSVFDVTDASSFDGEAVYAEAQEGCLEDFTVFVGRDYWESDLDIFLLSPSIDTWGVGDREVICAVVTLDGSLVTGSLENSNR